MPFGYLEFSRAIWGKPYPLAGRRRCRVRVGSGSGSLPDPVLFEPGLTVMGYRGSYPLRHPDLNCPAQRQSANRHEQLCGCCGCCLKRTVATVQTEPLQLFGWVRTIIPLAERYLALRFSQTKHKTHNRSNTGKEILPPHSELGFLQLKFEVTSNRKWGFCNLDSEVTSKRF